MSPDDFSVLIAWSGPEDKPFYRALLVSASRSGLIDHQPFWGYAIISRPELNQLIAVLQTDGCAEAPGRYTGTGPEYYVEIERAEQVDHYALGFDRQTQTILARLAAVLAADHRQPIEQIATRISSAIR